MALDEDAQGSIGAVKTVMVVDDSATIRQLVGIALGDAGYDVVSAASAKEALAKLKDTPVAMVLSDIAMPDMDGMEFTRRLRATEGCRDTPVVLLTKEPQGWTLQEAAAAGVSGWLVKPFTLDQLIGSMRNHIG